MNSLEYNLKIKSKVKIQKGHFFKIRSEDIKTVIIPAGLFLSMFINSVSGFLIIYFILKFELAINFKKPGCFFNKFNSPVREILANLERILR